MKKTSHILTALALSLSLAACGGGGSGGASSESYSYGGNPSNKSPLIGSKASHFIINYDPISEAPSNPSLNYGVFAKFFDPLKYQADSLKGGSTNPQDYPESAQYNKKLYPGAVGYKPIIDQSQELPPYLSYLPTEAFYKNEFQPYHGYYHFSNHLDKKLASQEGKDLKIKTFPTDPANQYVNHYVKESHLLYSGSIPHYFQYLLTNTEQSPQEAPTLAIANKAGLLTANRADNLLDLVSAEEGKVLVIDQDLTQNSPLTKEFLDNGRLSIVYLEDKDGQPMEKSSHAEWIANTIMGGKRQNLSKDPSDNSTRDPADKYLQALFAKKGSVKILTEYKNNPSTSFINSWIYSSPQLLAAIDDGYTIINESFATIFTPEYINETLHYLHGVYIPEENRWLFNKQIEHNKLDLGQILYRYFAKSEGAEHNHFALLQAQEKLIKEKDVLFIRAAGNYNPKPSSSILAPDAYAHALPAYNDGYIAVTSYVENEGLDKARVHYPNHCNQSRFYCLAAYDASTFTDTDGREKINYGSSFATPYVASAAGLVKSVFPFMHNSELQQTLLTTAKDIGEKGIDDVYGWGLVQPQVAINGPKAIFRNFVVDFDYRRKGAIPEYTFANSIQAYHSPDPEKNAIKLSAEKLAKLKELQLIVKHPGVLTLSNHNPFDGKTIVTQGATLDLTGSIQGEIFVDSDSHLYSQGQAHIVNNKGHVYNYSRTPHTEAELLEIKNLVNYCSSLRVPHSYCIVTRSKDPHDPLYLESYDYKGFITPVIKNFKVTNFTQDAGGTLHLYLGDPLLVTNETKLDGTLAIDGIRNLYRFIDHPYTFYGLALLSGRAIKGQFTKIDTQALPFTNLSLDPDHYLYNRIYLQDYSTSAYSLEDYSTDGFNIKNAEFYYYFLVLRLKDLNQGFMSLPLNKEEQAFSSDGLVNLQALEETLATESLKEETKQPSSLLGASIQPTARASSLPSASFPQANSALATFLTGLKLSNQQVAKESLLAFSGSEYSRTFRNNQALSAFNSSELWIDHGQEQGFTSSFNLQQALANNNYNQTRNRLALAYGEENYHLLTALNYGSSAWDNPLSLGRSASKVLGLNLVGSYNYQGYNLALGLDYSHHNNKVRRELNILGKAHNFTQELTNDALDLSLLLAKNFNLEFLTFSPYLSLSYQSNRVGAFSEQLSSGIQSFTLGSDAQSYNFISPLLVFKLSKEINHNLSFLANVSYKYLPAGKLQARLKDKSHNIEQSFSFAKDHLFTVKSGLKYHFNDRMSLDVKGGLRKLSSYNGWTKELSATLGYHF